MWQQLSLVILCLLIVLGALGFAGWTLISGQIQRQGIDALFLVSVCLLIALMFVPIPLAAIRRGEMQQWLKQLKRRGVKGSEARDAAASPDSRESAEKVKQHSV